MQEKKREAQRRRDLNNESSVVEIETCGEKSDDKVWRPESKLKLKMYIQYSNRVLRSITVTKKRTTTRVREMLLSPEIQEWLQIHQVKTI